MKKSSFFKCLTTGVLTLGLSLTAVSSVFATEITFTNPKSDALEPIYKAGDVTMSTENLGYVKIVITKKFELSDQYQAYYLMDQLGLENGKLNTQFFNDSAKKTDGSDEEVGYVSEKMKFTILNGSGEAIKMLPGNEGENFDDQLFKVEACEITKFVTQQEKEDSLSVKWTIKVYGGASVKEEVNLSPWIPKTVENSDGSKK